MEMVQAVVIALVVGSSLLGVVVRVITSIRIRRYQKKESEEMVPSAPAEYLEQRARDDSPRQESRIPKGTYDDRLRAYRDLIDLLVRNTYKGFKLFNRLRDQFHWTEETWEEDDLENLYLLNQLDCEEEIDFIINLDWKSPLEELDELLALVLEKQYPSYRVDLPKATDYGEDMGVGDTGVLDDYSDALRKEDLQLGMIDTYGDDYIMVVHKTWDRDKVDEIVTRMGLDYYEMEIV